MACPDCDAVDDQRCSKDCPFLPGAPNNQKPLPETCGCVRHFHSGACWTLDTRIQREIYHCMKFNGQIDSATCRYFEALRRIAELEAEAKEYEKFLSRL